MLRTRSRPILAASAGLCLLLLAGCGPRAGTVTGKVTLDGKPLAGGMITFHGKSGAGDTTAEISEDGTYTANIFSGDYTVTVDTEYLKPPSGPSMGGGRPGMPGGGPPGGGGMRPGGGGPPKDGGGPPKGSQLPGNPADHGYVQSNPGDAAKKYVKIPAKYNSVGESGLTFSHAGGGQTYDIPLVSK